MGGDRQLRARQDGALKSDIPRNRPSRLLNASAKSFLNRPVRLANATQSPLLSLPAEIRNRIYQLVVGGNTMHIVKFGHRSKLRLTICSAAHDENESRLAIRHAGKATEINCYTQRHRRCGITTSTRDLPQGQINRDLNLLRACSQIHREAALLPFQCNTFALRRIAHLTEFLKLMVPAQSRAIQAIIFSGNPAQACYILSKFPDLRTIAVLIEVDQLSVPALVNKHVFEGHSLVDATQPSHTTLQKANMSLFDERHDNRGYQYSAKIDPDAMRKFPDIVEVRLLKEA